MSGSSLDGLDIAFAELNESAGKWNFEIKAAECYSYDLEWRNKLQNATSLNAYDYMLLHTSYGKYIGTEVNRFIEQNKLHHQVQLITSHGHTTFHAPHLRMTGQLGDGAAIAATTQINVVSDLRAMDIAFGGQGAPIVPIGEKLLLGEYDYFLNLGGIANVSFNSNENYTAFDVCSANRILNLLVAAEGKEYDDGGNIASLGMVHTPLLTKLNALDYYMQPYPKSLANSFGVDMVLPIINSFGLNTADALRTYVEHIAMQVVYAFQQNIKGTVASRLLVTGGGAFNTFLIERLRAPLSSLGIELVIAGDDIIQYKEALIMGLMGVLRWREEYNVFHTVTGAVRSSIGGAVWIGQEA